MRQQDSFTDRGWSRAFARWLLRSTTLPVAAVVMLTAGDAGAQADWSSAKRSDVSKTTSTNLDRAENAGEARNYPEHPPLEFYVSDFGINQYQGKGDRKGRRLKTGNDFVDARSSVLPARTGQAQVLIVMPSYEALTSITEDSRLSDDILRTVRSKVKSSLAQGTTRFELQLVQHVGTAAYFNADHQRAANRFGKIAYGAIKRMSEELAATGYHQRYHAVLGSNGTKVFVENVDAWRGCIHDATFFDGRAYKTPTMDAIRTLGAQNVRIFNTPATTRPPTPSSPNQSGTTTSPRSSSASFLASRLGGFIRRTVSTYPVPGTSQPCRLTTCSVSCLSCTTAGDTRSRSPSPAPTSFVPPAAYCR